MLNQDEQTILSTKLPFWNNLTKQQQKFLISSSHSVHFAPNQLLRYADHECIGLLMVKEGTLRVFITSEEGREVTLYRIDKGEFCILSASCILRSISFDVTIIAESDCNVLQLSASALSKLSAENVYVELFTYQLATERFSDVMWSMEQILFISFDKRLAAFLLDEALKQNSDTIHITHEQIARYLGSAREVVSRMLKYFSKEGLVALSRGGITLLDKERLRKIVS